MAKRRYDAQIVIMDYQPMKDFIEAKSAQIEDSQSQVGRDMLDFARLGWEVADEIGVPLATVRESLEGLREQHRARA